METAERRPYGEVITSTVYTGRDRQTIREAVIRATAKYNGPLDPIDEEPTENLEGRLVFTTSIKSTEHL